MISSWVSEIPLCNAFGRLSVLMRGAGKTSPPTQSGIVYCGRCGVNKRAVDWKLTMIKSFGHLAIYIDPRAAIVGLVSHTRT